MGFSSLALSLCVRAKKLMRSLSHRFFHLKRIYANCTRFCVEKIHEFEKGYSISTQIVLVLISTCFLVNKYLSIFDDCDIVCMLRNCEQRQKYVRIRYMRAEYT